MVNKTYKPQRTGHVRKIYAYNFSQSLALNLTIHDGKSGYATLPNTLYLSEEGVKALKRAIRAWEKQRAEMAPIDTDLEPR